MLAQNAKREYICIIIYGLIIYNKTKDMKNPIQELNEHCQKVEIPLADWKFSQISVTPSEWKASCLLDEYFTEAIGPTKKHAKALAANNMIKRLKHEEIWWEQLAGPRKPIFIDKSDYKPGKHPKVWQPRN